MEVTNGRINMGVAHSTRPFVGHEVEIRPGSRFKQLTAEFTLLTLLEMLLIKDIGNSKQISLRHCYIKCKVRVQEQALV